MCNKGLKIEVGIELTPKMVAQWFWDNNSLTQADFLEELALYIQEVSPNAYGLGEMQWCLLRNELRNPERKLASEMLMALSAFAYDYAQQKGSL